MSICLKEGLLSGITKSEKLAEEGIVKFVKKPEIVVSGFFSWKYGGIIIGIYNGGSY